MTLRNILFASVVILAAGPALAQTNGPNNASNSSLFNQQAGTLNAYNGGSTLNAAGGAGGMGGNAAGGTGGSVTNNVTGGNFNYPRQAPPVSLGVATAYCGNSAGGGGSGSGFGFSALFGWHDRDCKRQNYALILAALGQADAALLEIANDKEVNAAIWEAHRQRQARSAESRERIPLSETVALYPNTAREPRPSAAQCASIARLRDPSQVQRDYLAANCR